MVITLTDTEARRFVEKIRLEPATGCWVWQAGSSQGNSKSSKDRGGYGIFYLRGRTRLAHKVMAEALWGPAKGTIDHLCRNPACVNPRHFEDVPLRVNLLRGRGVFAQNARKTHCKRGHEFTPENTGKQKGGRYCRMCRRADWRRYHAAHPNRR